MLRLLSRYIALPFLVICCATNIKAPPPAQTREEIRTLSSEALESRVVEMTKNSQRDPYSETQARYLLAQKSKELEPEKACQDFKVLASDTKFWARELAVLRALEICEDFKVPTEEVETIKLSAWFDLERIRVLLKQKPLDETLEMKLRYELAQKLTLKKEKISEVEKALALSQKLGAKPEQDVYQEALYRLAPRKRPNPPTESLMLVADDHRNAREFQAARRIYNQIFSNKKNSIPERLKALEGIARSFKIQGLKAENITGLTRITTFLEEQRKVRPKDRSLMKALEDAYVALARAQWTEGQTTAAKSTLQKSIKHFNGIKSVENTYWVLARIHEEAEDYNVALEWLDKSLSEPRLTPQFTEAALWQKAWILRKQQKWAESVTALEALVATALTPFGRSKYGYWLAQSYQAAGDTEKFNTQIEDVIAFDRYSFYSLIAQYQLKRPLKMSDVRAETVPMPEVKESSFDELMFTWLVDVNEVALARRGLEQHLSKNPHESKLRLAQMARVGLYNRVYGELTAMPIETRNDFIKTHIEFFFPRDFYSEYEKAAQDSGADVHLLMAITRQESGFDPFARSPADAFGLMQILHEVATTVSRKLNVTYSGYEDLYKPEINVPIGAYFIQSLLKEHDNKFITSVASYNANKNAVKNWIKVRYKGDVISFIEDIPYEETKGYIKLVMRNYVFYSLLNSNSEELQIPEWLLTL